ncbi:iron ABC transporter permease [Streptomyces sp. BE282]|uniref:FecCD family ABC transporter permease n=1 Tax=unclassified Streptomyces TaxID=2593676 RepID=UPI001A99A7C7|nr:MULTISPECIES: iron ABC transporter permease [unclassified Streptomyces]MEE1733139.1 iron ABC transporter permease [Streptomyces sp. BE282]QTA30320.1 iron ABC transporter permease [Streptomyces sp. CA-256286]
MELLTRSPAADASALRTETLARLLADRRARSRRTVLTVAVLAVLLTGLLVASVLLGGVGRVDPADVLPAAFGMRTGLADYMIFRIRVPRALAALLSGALFGLAGALYQRLIRNPLATPDIVGISAGAGAGATTVLLFAPALPLGAPLAAVTGSLVLLAAVYALSLRGGLNIYRLVLVGIGLSGVCTAYTNYLFSVADQHSIAVAMRWLIGSVNGVDWTGVSTLAIGLVVCALCAARLGRPLGSMSLGDELATGLGTSVPAARVSVLALGAGAAALATSVVGPIGFVSLISGPIAARLVGADRAFGLAPFVGAALVLGADVLAQNAPLISPVPTGVLTALLGAPYFVWLILRRRPGATS